MNKPRKNYKYKKGDLIFKKKSTKTQLNPLYLGPFKIKNIENDDQVLELKLAKIVRKDWRCTKNPPP